MPIDPYYRPRFQYLTEAFAAARSEQDIREAFRDLARRQPVWPCTDVTVEERAIPGPHGAINLRIYVPDSGEPGRALLWVHGGGFESGDLDMAEAHMVSAELSRRARALVVSVDYRLARDGVRFPIPLDDVHAAWTWLCAQASNIGLTQAPLAIGGASAGGALALGSALRARDERQRTPDLLLLAYPFVHFPVPPLDDATAAEMTSLPALEQMPAAVLERLVANYVGRTDDLPLYAMPGMARLDGAPTTHMVLCEYDVLRPSGELLARQLRDAAVTAEIFTASGVLHGHLNITDPLPQTLESLDFLADALLAQPRAGCSLNPGGTR